MKRKTVWDKCSKYNRLKDADHAGYVACCCCGKVKHYSEMDAGHFLPRTKSKSLYFEPTNIHAQCSGCNRNRFDAETAKIGYTLFMMRRYGKVRVETLIAQSRVPYRERATDLDGWNQFYTDKLKELDNA